MLLQEACKQTGMTSALQQTQPQRTSFNWQHAGFEFSAQPWRRRSFLHTLLVKTCLISSMVALTAAFISFLQTYKIYIYKVLKQVHPVSAALDRCPQADPHVGLCLPDVSS